MVAGGYRVVERNYRGGGAEIDLIAWQGDVLCFVEVRARRSAACGSPEATVDRIKQRKIIRGAKAYLCQRFERWPMVRFDVVAIQGAQDQVEVFQNAFEAGE